MKLTKDILTEASLLDFGDSVHWLRADNNLTLPQAARRLGLSPQALEELETGRADAIDFRLICKLCKLFKTRLTLDLGDDYD